MWHNFSIFLVNRRDTSGVLYDEYAVSDLGGAPRESTHSGEQPMTWPDLDPVPVLLYHAVSDDPVDWIAPYTVSPAMFAAHLDVVVATGRVPLTVSQFADGLRGAGPLPARPVLITVDDGFADFAEYAMPALAERNLPSTLYMITGALAGSRWECVLPQARMLGPADLPDLEAAGVEIGAHSHTHPQLDLLPAHTAADELARSRDVLADALGHRIRSFAYPHGYWRAAVRRLVASAGFDSACAVGNALCRAEDHLLALPRLMVMAGDDASTIAGWLDGSGARAPSPGHRVLSFGWRQGWRQYRRAQQHYANGRPAASRRAA
jgi:peptidoglycan/xylan/chitin deacetylase (PgdA/CDA1 family)